MIRPMLRWPSRAGRMMVLLLAAASAHADPKQAAPKTVVTLAYSSVFGTYKSHADQPVTSWRGANDTVGRIGGWRGYAREASQEASPAAPAAAGSAPAAAGHDDDHTAHHGGRR